VGLMERAVMGDEQVEKMCGVSGGWWGGGGVSGNFCPTFHNIPFNFKKFIKC
jgi:hypothetical protein